MRTGIITGAAVLLAAGSASADLVLQLANPYTGSAPAGAAPWATATFSQTGTDSVRLSIQSALSASEFISNMYFNVEPGQAVSGVFNAGLSTGAFQAPSLAVGNNNQNAGGGARYDLRIAFPINQPANRFGGTDLAVFDLSGAGLTEDDFDFLSTAGGGGLAFLTAAHVQGIGPNASGSGWLASGTVIPLPAGAGTGLAGLAMVAGLSYLRRRGRA